MLTYPIKGPWAGELAIVPRPRGGDWLEDETASLRSAGFDVVVSLLTPEEAMELDLTREADFLQQRGLQFLNFPIPDLGVPSSDDSAHDFIKRLHQQVVSGKRIAIHCRASIGRAGLIAAGILVFAGIEPGRAMREVTNARHFESPETAEQQDWIVELAAELAGSPA